MHAPQLTAWYLLLLPKPGMDAAESFEVDPHEVPHHPPVLKRGTGGKYGGEDQAVSCAASFTMRLLGPTPHLYVCCAAQARAQGLWAQHQSCDHLSAVSLHCCLGLWLCPCACAVCRPGAGSDAEQHIPAGARAVHLCKPGPAGEAQMLTGARRFLFRLWRHTTHITLCAPYAAVSEGQHGPGKSAGSAHVAVAPSRPQ